MNHGRREWPTGREDHAGTPGPRPIRIPREQLQELVSRLGQEIVASLVMIVDSAGQPRAHWYRLGEVDIAGIATLTMGSMVARQALSIQMGGGPQQSIVVHEYDDLTMVLTRVDADLVLIAVIEDRGRLGWVRLALQRASRQLVALRSAIDARAAQVGGAR